MLLKKIIGNLFGFNRKIKKLEKEIEMLSYDDPFGIITRPALFIKIDTFLKKHKKPIIVFLDFDRLHDLNNKYGYEAINTRIKKFFTDIKIRKSECVIGRYFSGDEIIIAFPDSSIAEVKSCMYRIRNTAIKFKLSFTYAFKEWDGGKRIFLDCIYELANEVKKKKLSFINKMYSALQTILNMQ